MTPLSQTIFDNFQTRKSDAQKSAFIALMQEHFPKMTIEESGRLLRNRNLVVGDIKNAQYVFTAHYDTCAQLPFPNFMAPRNPFALILLILAFSIAFFLLGMLLGVVGHVVNLPPIFPFFVLLPAALLFQLLILFGKANKHTANDNTSGVITLCEILHLLSDEEKAKIAVVFFDNEEIGLVGSSRFQKKYHKEMKNKLLLNFDCVSDGDNIALCISKKAKVKNQQELEAAFCPHKNKTILFWNSRTTFYPSDQIHFPQNVAVASFNKSRIFGYYMNKIHTKHDTVFMEENILYLASCCKNLIQANNTTCQHTQNQV